jgi:hypothetical protein
MRAVAAMSVPAMHEQVHEDAAKRQHIDKRAENMGAVFREEQEAADREKGEQDEPGS